MNSFTHAFYKYGNTNLLIWLKNISEGRELNIAYVMTKIIATNWLQLIQKINLRQLFFQPWWNLFNCILKETYDELGGNISRSKETPSWLQKILESSRLSFEENLSWIFVTPDKAKCHENSQKRAGPLQKDFCYRKSYRKVSPEGNFLVHIRFERLPIK